MEGSRKHPAGPISLARSRARDVKERIIQSLMFIAAAISVLTTLGIILSLASETIAFFREVSLFEFLTETQWTPLFSIKKYGILPLVAGTFLTAAIALAVAVPLGLCIALYLSEFASARRRDIVKPLLEILAGVPTVVYGYFALITVTPFLQQFIPGLSGLNSLGAGLVMGIMILPLVASLSEDALSAVPRALREGGFAVGATRFEVALKIVFPAAISGIVASIILALSRAVGETMIVAIAAGQNPRLTLDPRVPIETMTTYIVQVSLGDTPYGSLSYLTLFAVGMTLFVITLIMNLFSQWFVRRYREVYE